MYLGEYRQESIECGPEEKASLPLHNGRPEPGVERHRRSVVPKIVEVEVT
jgi:hypothetical protein